MIDTVSRRSKGEVVIVLVSLVAASAVTFAVLGKGAPQYKGTLLVHHEEQVSSTSQVVVDRFSIENVGVYPLEKLQLVSSCGCTTVEAPNRLAPGQKGFFTLKVLRSATDPLLPIGLSVLSGKQLVRKYVVRNFTNIEDYNPKATMEEPGCKSP